jgi:hypothetical protein
VNGTERLFRDPAMGYFDPPNWSLLENVELEASRRAAVPRYS